MQQSMFCFAFFFGDKAVSRNFTGGMEHQRDSDEPYTFIPTKSDVWGVLQH